MRKFIMLGMALTVSVAVLMTSCKKDDTTNNGNNDGIGGAPTGYVDLGLPSGTKWNSSNETTGSSGGLYTYEEAVSAFGDKLPTKEQCEELKNNCTWEWQNNGGYKITGINGNSIILPAAGCRYCGGDVGDVGSWGFYWSSTPYGSDAYSLYFLLTHVDLSPGDRCLGRSVRLVQD